MRSASHNLMGECELGHTFANEGIYWTGILISVGANCVFLRTLGYCFHVVSICVCRFDRWGNLEIKIARCTRNGIGYENFMPQNALQVALTELKTIKINS